MKFLITLLALLPLMGSCQTPPGAPSPVNVVADFEGDGWLYADTDCQMFVGSGAAHLRATAYGMAVVPVFPTSFDEQTVWLKHKERGEYWLDLGDSWPLWAEAKLTQQSLDELAEHFGLFVTFE